MAMQRDDGRQRTRGVGRPHPEVTTGQEYAPMREWIWPINARMCCAFRMPNGSRPRVDFRGVCRGVSHAGGFLTARRARPGRPDPRRARRADAGPAGALASTSTRPVPERRVSTIVVLSGVERTGLWRIAETSSLLVVLGSCKLDLRRATIAASLTTIHVRVVLRQPRSDRAARRRGRAGRLERAVEQDPARDRPKPGRRAAADRHHRRGRRRVADGARLVRRPRLASLADGRLLASIKGEHAPWAS